VHTELHPRFEDSGEAREAADLISACVHCGFCLATCPTYLDSRDERDSPRGRIYLVKQLLEQGEATALSQKHLDRCLSCRSCETTCPSGMAYGRMADIGRGLLEADELRPAPWRLLRSALRNVLSRPALFGTLLRLGQWVRPLAPGALKSMIPPRQVVPAAPTETHPRTMLVLDGCVQRGATPRTNASARRVLHHLGITLQSVSAAGCCGAVNYHLGAQQQGLDNMRRNIDAWWPAIEAGAEAILSTASGCGAMLSEYGELLAADPRYADKARRVSDLTRDIGEIILDEDLTRLAPPPGNKRVAVQIPCSLQHGLKLPDLIPRILQQAGFTLTATTDDHLCCGSAGTYSILQPGTAGRLRQRKLAGLSGDGPEIIATGNVGCQLHLQAATDIPVVHWIELLDKDAPDGRDP
jgi:glycolate oxidase iron-sulfur subunit